MFNYFEHNLIVYGCNYIFYIKNYTIYYSENNSDYKPWVTNTKGESSYFFGESGKTYYFYSSLN